MAKKLKITGTQAPQTPPGVRGGVRTRAQTLALLQNLHLRTQTSSSSPNKLGSFDLQQRGTRESTLCRDFDSNGSAVRSTSSAAAYENSVRINPCTSEMEEFLGCSEKQQQQYFVEKYNFDIANDLPLPGRYDWVRIGS